MERIQKIAPAYKYSARAQMNCSYHPTVRRNQSQAALPCPPRSAALLASFLLSLRFPDFSTNSNLIRNILKPDGVLAAFGESEAGCVHSWEAEEFEPCGWWERPLPTAYYTIIFLAAWLRAGTVARAWVRINLLISGVRLRIRLHYVNALRNPSPITR